VGFHPFESKSGIGASIGERITLRRSSHGYWEGIKSNGSISQSF